MGHIYTDQLNDTEFGISYDNSELLKLYRNVEVYCTPNDKLKWQYDHIEPTGCPDDDDGQNGSVSIPFSIETFTAETIYFDFGYNDDNSYNTIQLLWDDLPIMNSVQTWDVPPVDTQLSLSMMIANITNTAPKYKRMPNIESSSTNQFIYRPVSIETTSKLLCGDVRITYRMLPVPTTAVSIVA